MDAAQEIRHGHTITTTGETREGSAIQGGGLHDVALYLAEESAALGEAIDKLAATVDPIARRDRDNDKILLSTADTRIENEADAPLVVRFRRHGDEIADHRARLHEIIRRLAI